MRVIPVIDLMNGVVVRGVAGRRSEYRAIESPLCQSAEPAAVARAIGERFGLSEFYVADLDAITGSEPAWSVYEKLAEGGRRLLVDAGVTDVRRGAALAGFRAGGETLAGVIVGLESLAPIGGRAAAGSEDSNMLPPHPTLSPGGGEGFEDSQTASDELREALRPLVDTVGVERLIFSVDLKAGQPLARVERWRTMSPVAIAEAAIAAKVRRLIVLDLADVGTGGGVGTLAIVRQARAAHPGIELIAGGGVRGPEDLRAMAAAGCDAALVASALHDGRLNGNDEW